MFRKPCSIGFAGQFSSSKGQLRNRKSQRRSELLPSLLGNLPINRTTRLADFESAELERCGFPLTY